MVKVNGFQIKGFKHWAGMENEGMAGDMYYNGKPVFSFVDEGRGGSMIFLDQTALKDVAEQRMLDILRKHELIEERFTSDRSFVKEIFISLLIKIDENFKGIKKWGRNINAQTLCMAIGSIVVGADTQYSYTDVDIMGGTTKEVATKELEKTWNLNKHIAQVSFSPSDRNLTLDI